MNSPEIVLLHGWGCDRSIWAALEARLRSAGRRVTAVDFPGFGASAEPPEPWGMEDYTRWLEAPAGWKIF